LVSRDRPQYAIDRRLTTDAGHPVAVGNPVRPASAGRPVEGLTLGPGLVLPVEAVTETFAILAKRGAGKTYTAAVLVEEMMGAALPVVIIDPVGVWWGLRSSALEDLGRRIRRIGQERA
jgi:DNA helicase HerA-like ATPase